MSGVEKLQLITQIITKFNQLYFKSSPFSVNIQESHSEAEQQSVKTVINEASNHTEFSSDGIAVDWLYKKIYWTENSKDKIMVADYDGKKIKTLVSGDLDDPRAIVADPENG